MGNLTENERYIQGIVVAKSLVDMDLRDVSGVYSATANHVARLLRVMGYQEDVRMMAKIRGNEHHSADMYNRYLLGIRDAMHQDNSYELNEWIKQLDVMLASQFGQVEESR